MHDPSKAKLLSDLLQATRALDETRANMPRYNRRMIVMVGVVAFVLGVVLGGAVTFYSIDRVTVISLGPKTQV